MNTTTCWMYCLSAAGWCYCTLNILCFTILTIMSYCSSNLFHFQPMSYPVLSMQMSSCCTSQTNYACASSKRKLSRRQLMRNTDSWRQPTWNRWYTIFFPLSIHRCSALLVGITSTLMPTTLIIPGDRLGTYRSTDLD